MRRLLAAGILLAIIVVACIWGNVTVSDVCGKAADIAKDAEKECVSGDFGSAIASCERLSEYWKKHKRMVSFFVNHGDVEELSSRIKSLYVLAEEKDSAVFREKIREILHLLEKISGEQRFSPDIFI